MAGELWSLLAGYGRGARTKAVTDQNNAYRQSQMDARLRAEKFEHDKWELQQKQEAAKAQRQKQMDLNKYINDDLLDAAETEKFAMSMAHDPDAVNAIRASYLQRRKARESQVAAFAGPEGGALPAYTPPTIRSPRPKPETVAKYLNEVTDELRNMSSIDNAAVDAAKVRLQALGVPPEEIDRYFQLSEVRGAPMMVQDQAKAKVGVSDVNGMKQVIAIDPATGQKVKQYIRQQTYRDRFPLSENARMAQQRAEEQAAFKKQQLDLQREGLELRRQAIEDRKATAGMMRSMNDSWRAIMLADKRSARQQALVGKALDNYHTSFSEINNRIARLEDNPAHKDDPVIKKNLETLYGVRRYIQDYGQRLYSAAGGSDGGMFPSGSLPPGPYMLEPEMLAKMAGLNTGGKPPVAPKPKPRQTNLGRSGGGNSGKTEKIIAALNHLGNKHKAKQ